MNHFYTIQFFTHNPHVDGQWTVEHAPIGAVSTIAAIKKLERILLEDGWTKSEFKIGEIDVDYDDPYDHGEFFLWEEGTGSPYGDGTFSENAPASESIPDDYGYF